MNDIQHINRSAIAIAEKHQIGIDDAIDIMNKKSIWLIANRSIYDSFSKQLSFITALNIAHRVFLNDVYCVIPLNVPNLLKFKEKDFNDLITRFGGVISDDNSTEEDAKLLFGLECYDSKCIEIVACGWRGGVNFFGNERIVLPDTNNIPLGPIAAASIGTFYAFCKAFQICETVDINVGISLWDLNSGKDWSVDINDGPVKIYLPRTIWSLGLGHLGQAYIWCLGLFQTTKNNSTQFLLQDSDIIDKENLGSQVLSFEDDLERIDRFKTRACMRFLEEMNFKTRIVEKRFEAKDDMQDWMSEYPILLNGVDNVQTRKSINSQNVKLYIDGATNGSSDLFDSFTLKNVFELKKDMDKIWPIYDDKEVILHRNLFDRYEKEHKCGVLSNIGISTPFVGLFSSTIVVSELLRSLNKGRKYSIVSLQLRDIGSITAVEEGLYNNELLRYAIE
jgi:molybdopterin/thiamine biosynthesis adenylyltransferase